jgi:uncharacterized membrane protein SpoIIM required for sporulation
MKVAELLETRRDNWRELEGLVSLVKAQRFRAIGPRKLCRFASLYRAACADLALADAYQLPPGTVQYLHDLVGRAHNQLYRSQRFNFRAWGRDLFQVLPGQLIRDRCLWLAFVLFWGVFLGTMVLAWRSPDFAERLVGKQELESVEKMHADSIGDIDPNQSSLMVGFYIFHNTGIGLQCFAGGLFMGIGGVFTTVFNAATLGTIFGFMITSPSHENFFQFVTAHGPFELTAIVISAGAGMRLGFSQINTGGLTRQASLRASAVQAMPMMGVLMVLFFLAAMIEAFLSPSSAPYWVKALVAAISTALLLFYFFGLGLRQAGREPAGPGGSGGKASGNPAARHVDSGQTLSGQAASGQTLSGEVLTGSVLSDQAVPNQRQAATGQDSLGQDSPDWGPRHAIG